jgi:hypothetical protein
MRQYSTWNLGVYVTAWAVFMAIPLALDVVADKLPWGFRRIVAFAIIAIFSMLTGGALGFAIGGRTWFWLSSCLTFVVILAILFHPAIIAAM